VTAEEIGPRLTEYAFVKYLLITLVGRYSSVCVSGQ